MKSSLLYEKEYSAYPGEYIPMPETEALLNELKLTAKDSCIKPLVNLDEYDDCFKIEVALPGIKREEIFIQSHDTILQVAVLRNAHEMPEKKLQIHEFDNKNFHRNILLPENADVEFIAAEYREGILKIYIPKDGESSIISINHVVVY